MRNLGEAFRFPFKDPNWLAKLTIGAFFTLLSIALIGIPVLYGYYLELLRRVRNGEQYPLPEWKDVGVKFISGIKYLVTLWIYYFPLAIVAIPVIVLILLSSVQGTHLFDVMGRAVGAGVLIFVAIPYSLFVLVLTPLISVEFSRNERVGEGINIGRVIRLFGRHWQESLIIVVITIGIDIAASLGLVLLIIGILFTSFYVSLVRFHLYGQIGQMITPAVS